MRRTPWLMLAALLAGCPPNDTPDMGFDMDQLDRGMIDRGDRTDDGVRDGDVPDRGQDMGPDQGPDGGACEDPPDAAPPNPLPSEGYAGCFRDRFQIELKASIDPNTEPNLNGDLLDILAVNVANALEADLNAGALDENWWPSRPTISVAAITQAHRFWQAEFRNDDGELMPVDRRYQCVVIERVIAAVDSLEDNAAITFSDFFNIGRACPVVALGALDEPSLDMRAWHLRSMGVPAADAAEHPVIPRGPVSGATQGARVVVIDSGIDPRLIDVLGIEELPPAEDLAEGPPNPHGSAMAILIRQLAPDAKLQSLRILGPDNVGAIADLAQALETATFNDTCGGDYVPANTCQTCAEADQDPDLDGWCAEQDNCPVDANPDQADADADGTGDACDAYHCVPTGDDVCDGLDNDCDGQTDEAPGHACADMGCGQVAACSDGQPVCLDAQASTLEVCDGVVQECSAQDGEVVIHLLCAVDDDWCRAGRTDCTDGVESCIGDAALSCNGAPGCNPDDMGQACFVPGQGACAGGISVCRNGQLACEQAWQPTAFDRCGDGDTDCDGAVDEDASAGPCVTEFPGACAVGNWVCTPEGSVCAPTPAEEICNGIDDDCNGIADDGIDCTTCCDLDGQHRTLALAACPPEQRRDAEQCEVVCCADDGALRPAGDCGAVDNDEGACDVCCVDGQAAPGGLSQQPMIVNLSLGWPPELSQPRRLTGDPGPLTPGGECAVIEAPVGESVRWMLETLADYDTDAFPISVYAAAGNRPGRPRVDAAGNRVNPLVDVYTALFQVDRATPVDDACSGVQIDRPVAPFWFLPGGFARNPSCFDGPFDPRYLTMGLGGITDTDLPTAQSIIGAQSPLVAPGQLVYVDHPELPRRDAICDVDETEQDGMRGPLPYTGTSVPTALASGFAARAMAIREAAGAPALKRRAQFRLMYFTGRPVDPSEPNQARVSTLGGHPVHRLDACRMEFALTDPRCAPLRACIEETGGPDPLTPCTQPNALACLDSAEAANGGPCSERPRAAVPINPDYVPDEPCRDTRLCPQDWEDATSCIGPCPFETAPDRHSLGTLSGTPAVSGCPDCFVDALRGHFEVIINVQMLEVLSATLYYDQAPHDLNIKWQSLPTGAWYKGDTFTITDLAQYKGDVCPSYAKLDITHKDPATGQHISDTSAIRVKCK